MAVYGEMGDNDLKEWQRWQMQRCLIENTLNHVIETYSVLQQGTNAQQSNDNTENLEESAILMAISEHGLQQSLQSDSCVPQQCATHQEKSLDQNSAANETDHFNVLETAVSVAIQNQGLSLLGPNR